MRQSSISGQIKFWKTKESQFDVQSDSWVLHSHFSDRSSRQYRKVKKIGKKRHISNIFRYDNGIIGSGMAVYGYLH